MEHSKLPWEVSYNISTVNIRNSECNDDITDWVVFNDEFDSVNLNDAEFIVEACNNYEKLQQENEKLINALKQVRELLTAK